MSSERPKPDPAKVLEIPVHAAGGSKRFGDLTRADVWARARELREAVGFGPTARVAPVAMAWTALARQMEQEGAATVADLGAARAAERAEALWVVPPGGSLL